MSLFHFHTQQQELQRTTCPLVGYPRTKVSPPAPHLCWSNLLPPSPHWTAVILLSFLCAISVLFVFDCDFINMFCCRFRSLVSLIEMFSGPQSRKSDAEHRNGSHVWATLFPQGQLNPYIKLNGRGVSPQLINNKLWISLELGIECRVVIRWAKCVCDYSIRSPLNLLNDVWFDEWVTVYICVCLRMCECVCGLIKLLHNVW